MYTNSLCLYVCSFHVLFPRHSSLTTKPHLLVVMAIPVTPGRNTSREGQSVHCGQQVSRPGAVFCLASRSSLALRSRGLAHLTSVRSPTPSSPMGQEGAFHVLYPPTHLWHTNTVWRPPDIPITTHNATPPLVISARFPPQLPHWKSRKIYVHLGYTLQVNRFVCLNYAWDTLTLSLREGRPTRARQRLTSWRPSTDQNNNKQNRVSCPLLGTSSLVKKSITCIDQRACTPARALPTDRLNVCQGSLGV